MATLNNWLKIKEHRRKVEKDWPKWTMLYTDSLGRKCRRTIKAPTIRKAMQKIGVSTSQLHTHGRVAPGREDPEDLTI
jgi:hypothetical protein